MVVVKEGSNVPNHLGLTAVIRAIAPSTTIATAAAAASIATAAAAVACL
jgi:hypothetical protein